MAGLGHFDGHGATACSSSILIGRCDMKYGPDNPFLCVDRILKENEGRYDVALVEFHANATSEKLAMGYYLDGRVSAVWGTHTHVQTADERVNPKGTGYITDLGMTGPYHSVLGVRIEQSIAMFRGDLTEYFKTAPGDCAVSGAVFDIERGGKCNRQPVERGVEGIQGPLRLCTNVHSRGQVSVTGKLLEIEYFCTFCKKLKWNLQNCAKSVDETEGFAVCYISNNNGP
ncbi:MAG: YmdB family metallophosphoesterase [Butyricicoccaceae bacterium]